MNEEVRLIRIGDFAKLFNVSIKTVRYYESIGLIVPAFVDVYSGYRYFDFGNIERMQEILSLKELGFSLEEIKNFKTEKIKSKIVDYQNKIKLLYKQIESLEILSFKGLENLHKRSFINDPNAVGKWKLLGVSKNREDAKAKKFFEDSFSIKELYLLPNGEAYWVISWTKDYIYIHNKECPYKISEPYMYLTIPDDFDSNIFKVVVYERIDNKEYMIDEIQIKDDTNIDFILDEKLVGFWHAVDFVHNILEFNPNHVQFRGELYLQKMSFWPDGNVHINYLGNDFVKQTRFTKDYIIDFCLPNTLSKYIINEIDGRTYLFIEWKSGDYVYGGVVNGYYVLLKD